MDSSTSPRCMGHRFSIIHYFTASCLVPWLRVMTVLQEWWKSYPLWTSRWCQPSSVSSILLESWKWSEYLYWSECVTLWVCTWLQSLCPTVEEQSLFPCNWSFHLLPWYSHVTEQIFNYLWLGQQRPSGHCRHLERISPAYMRLVSPCAVSADGGGSLQFLWMSRWKFEIPRLSSLALLMAFACQISCRGYRFKWSYKMPSAFPWPSWSLTRRGFGWASLLEKRVLQLVWIPWEGR